MNKGQILFIAVIGEFLLLALFADLIADRKPFVRKVISHRHFSWLWYLLFIGLPVATSFVLYPEYSAVMIKAFALFGVLGTFLEWLVGFSFHHIMGVRLWTYDRYNIMRYTSFLSIPIWGFGGMLGWLIFKSLGLL